MKLKLKAAEAADVVERDLVDEPGLSVPAERSFLPRHRNASSTKEWNACANVPAWVLFKLIGYFITSLPTQVLKNDELAAAPCAVSFSA